MGKKLVAGLMSGTSLDGIDAVLLRVRGSGSSTRFEQLACVEHPFPRGLRTMLLRNSAPETSRVDEIARLNMLLPQLYAGAVRAVARKARIPINTIALIGSHGQTIHHLPRPVKMFGKTVRATLQIGDPSALATLTGIPTVGNFRVADMAAGGEGAPLVPYFDWLVFRSRTRGRMLLNIGGIANVTVVPKNCKASDVAAFDTGPGNMLVDGLMQRLYQRRFDRGGATARRGTVLPELLQFLAGHPYFRRKPPKSTGREMFGELLIEEILTRAKGERAEDVIHTAALLTPLAVFDAFERFIRRRSPVDEIIVSGGGARNLFFLEGLRELFGGIALGTADDYGISSDAKEAICFAILANETIAGNPANLPRVTGARRPVVLGAVCRP
jgi:anhydro-N-acetylmuramic acid kinase